jgi:hypothetical protein
LPIGGQGLFFAEKNILTAIGVDGQGLFLKKKHPTAFVGVTYGHWIFEFLSQSSHPFFKN